MTGVLIIVLAVVFVAFVLFEVVGKRAAERPQAPYFYRKVVGEAYEAMRDGARHTGDKP